MMTFSARTTLSLVVPIRGAMPGLTALVEDALALLPQVCSEVEIILIAAQDTDASVAERLAQFHAPVLLLRTAAGSGYGTGLRTGLTYARGDYVIIPDGRGQLALAHMLRLLPLAREHDIVQVVRTAIDTPTFPWSLLAQAPLRAVYDRLGSIFSAASARRLLLSADSLAIWAEIEAVAQMLHWNMRVVTLPEMPLAYGDSYTHSLDEQRRIARDLAQQYASQLLAKMPDIRLLRSQRMWYHGVVAGAVAGAVLGYFALRRRKT